jgi:Asp-tRNA(Asn)/Glu-tRNA(Gln) amidotransferase A subunit family amidase
MALEVRHKDMSPRELIRAHLDRIEQIDPDLNAFVYLDQYSALHTAAEAEKLVQRGAELGPLRGVPLTIKSSIAVAGWRCEAGVSSP